MLLIGLFLVVMLFITSRKDSKARKQQAELLASIKQGDRVVTHAGIHGVVHRLEEKTVTLLLDTAQVTFERAAIARVVRDDARADAKSA
ncbi:MAG: preprotein translocase subunit YajC [Planctomycetes bacterium]|nr:preprotein translocase subunit YajC [Planctomycetota bacterium]